MNTPSMNSNDSQVSQDHYSPAFSMQTTMDSILDNQPPALDPDCSTAPSTAPSTVPQDTVIPAFQMDSQMSSLLSSIDPGTLQVNYDPYTPFYRNTTAEEWDLWGVSRRIDDVELGVLNGNQKIEKLETLLLSVEAQLKDQVVVLKDLTDMHKSIKLLCGLLLSQE